jgi:hypothetical protein
VPRWFRRCFLAICFLCLAAAFYYWRPATSKPPPPPPSSTSGTIAAQVPDINAGQTSDPARPKLPEAPPPPGLPIVDWGQRDFFPIIRNPVYVTAGDGDNLLLDTEPVLGVVIGKEARAYSTNQLNRHEMVTDEIAGMPVLVTY